MNKVDIISYELKPYRGYFVSIYQNKLKRFMCRITGINENITWISLSLEEAEEIFHKEVDEYIFEKQEQEVFNKIHGVK